jgi:outer membrane protein OmpA-like peptidoglycan-associated protein
MKAFEFRDTIESAEGDHWIPLADIMTVLMMIFLLIAVLVITRAQLGIGRVHKSLESYSETRSELYRDLQREFHTDLRAWHATIETNLGVRFVEPDILFATGQDRVKPRFAAILKDFFPRYVKVLSQSKYRKFIDEIRIEGYSSSNWGANVSRGDAYILNMALSQARTRSTLKYILSLPAAGGDSGWLIAHLTANGFSSSRPVRKPDGEEDAQDSQRVEFRVRTTADEQLLQIARAISE